MTPPPDALAELSDLLAADPGDSGRSASRGSRRAGRIVLWSFLAAIVLAGAAVGGYVAWALQAPLPEPTLRMSAPALPAPAPVPLELPERGAAAVSVTGGEEFFGAAGLEAARGADETRPLASITKLITALVVLDAYPLDEGDDGPTLTFDRADHALYDRYYVLDATIAAMPTGSSMSLRDALAMLVVPSASNYADAVASWAFGSRGGYVSATRSWLAENGMSGTTVVEPTGIDRANTSTAADLMILGRLAAAHPVVAELAGTTSLTLPGIGTVSNTNTLLGHDGITGLKTGNLGREAYNLLYTATLDVGIGRPLEVTGVALGGYSRGSVENGVVTVLDSIRSGFRDVPLARAGEPFGSARTTWGGSSRLVFADDASILVWSDTEVDVAVEPPDITAAGPSGSVTWTAGPRTATAPLRWEGKIEPPSVWWRLTHPGDLGD